MLLPLKDTTPLRHVRYQYVTVGLIATCVLVFLWQLGLGPREGQRMVYGLGMIPAVLFGQRALVPELDLVPPALTLLTSMFLHGGWLHLIGNMVFFWVFGDNVEDALGHRRFLAFYLLVGIAAALTQAFAAPASTLPTIGASGAISGVLGAYLLLHPRAQILVLAGFFLLPLPAWVVLGLWIGLQALNATADAGGAAGGVAWWAHVGGFVVGALLVVPMRRRGVKLFDGLSGAGAVGRAVLETPRRSSVPDSGRVRRPRR